MDTKKIRVGVIALATVGASYGAAIQFDFGTADTAVYDGVNAPAALSGTVSSWNGVSGADIASGLLYADGTGATDVALNVGTGDAVNWDNTLGTYTATDGATAALYTTDLMTDWNYARKANLGVQVSGLAAGDYEVYAIVREPTNLANTYDIGIGLNGSSLADLAYTGSIAADGEANGTATWTAGVNYVMTTVTVGSTTDAITVISDPVNGTFGSISGLQIVSIPEPATLGMITAFGGGMLFIRRRFMI
jgi:hypothetical protein